MRNGPKSHTSQVAKARNGPKGSAEWARSRMPASCRQPAAISPVTAAPRTTCGSAPAPLIQSGDERVALMAADKVFERAWGRPRDYDPDKEAPKKAPPFDPKLYTTDELRRMQEVMLMMARRQGLIPPEDVEGIEPAIQESRGESSSRPESAV